MDVDICCPHRFLSRLVQSEFGFRHQSITAIVAIRRFTVTGSRRNRWNVPAGIRGLCPVGLPPRRADGGGFRALPPRDRCHGIDRRRTRPPAPPFSMAGNARRSDSKRAPRALPKLPPARASLARSVDDPGPTPSNPFAVAPRGYSTSAPDREVVLWAGLRVIGPLTAIASVLTAADAAGGETWSTDNVEPKLRREGTARTDAPTGSAPRLALRRSEASLVPPPASPMSAAGKSFHPVGPPPLVRRDYQSRHSPCSQPANAESCYAHGIRRPEPGQAAVDGSLKSTRPNQYRASHQSPVRFHPPRSGSREVPPWIPVYQAVATVPGHHRSQESESENVFSRPGKSRRPRSSRPGELAGGIGTISQHLLRRAYLGNPAAPGWTVPPDRPFSFPGPDRDTSQRVGGTLPANGWPIPGKGVRGRANRREPLIEPFLPLHRLW